MRARLEDVCERDSSNLRQADVAGRSGDYPIYGASGYIGNVDFYHQELPYVAIVKDGAGIGRTVLLPAKSSVIGTMQYLLPKKNVLPEYLCYVVRYMHLEKYFSGATIPHIYFRDYKSEEFNLVPVDYQEEIVATLGKIEAIVAARQRQLQKLDELVKARFIELFGDPLIEDDRYPRVPLGSLAEVGSSKRIFEKEYVSEGIPFYRTKEIVELSKGNRITTELFITKERYDEIRSEYGVPQKGDLLISAVGTIGVIWIVDGKNDFYFKDGNLLRVSATEKFVPEYLKHLLEALISAYKSEMSSGTAYAALTISALKEMMVYDVPHAEQEQFAAFVEQTDKSKVAVQKALDEAQLLFDSLMQKYFGREGVV